MLAVDARSGRTLGPGDVVDYPDGTWTKLVSVSPGMFHAKAVLRQRYLTPVTPTPARLPDHWLGENSPMGPMAEWFVEDEIEVPLQVRWTHPKYFLQHVGFIPS